MPRLETFTLEIKTGESGHTSPLAYSINGFKLDFEQVEGGTGSGETVTATGNPQSFPHTLHLRGPEEGEWDIAGVTATYHPTGEEPYTLRFAALTLDEESDLNIWHQRPAAVLDV
jgi:hypothetical protein